MVFDGSPPTQETKPVQEETTRDRQGNPESGSDTATESLGRDDEQQQQQPAHPRDSITQGKWWTIILGNAFMSLVSGYDVSNVANVQVPIFEAFGHIELLPWVSLAYSLVNVATVPLARRLTGILELRLLTAVAWVFIAAGGALSAAAPSIQAVIVGRAVMAVGGALAYQIVLTYNVVFSKGNDIALAQSVVGIFFAVGLIMGPIVGAAFAVNKHATWRWAFYFHLIIATSVLLCALLYPTYRAPLAGPERHKSLGRRLREVDWLGAALHAATFVLLGLGCVFSGSTWAWGSGASVAVWVLFGVVAVAYALQQRFSIGTTPQRRVFPVSALRDRTSGLTSVCVFCAAMGYGLSLYYMPIYFAFTHGYGALQAAVHLLPFIGVFIGFIFLSAGLLPAVRYYQPVFLFGAAMMLVGAGLQQTLQPTTPGSRVMGFEAIVGAGVGTLWQIALPVSAVVLQRPERPHKAGGPAAGMAQDAHARGLDAAALFNMAQIGGAAVALAVAGCVYQNVGFARITQAVAGLGTTTFSSADVRALLAGVDSGLAAAEDPEVLALATSAVTETLRRCFYITMAAGALCFIAACGLRFEALEFKKKPADAEPPAKAGVTSVQGDEAAKESGAA